MANTYLLKAPMLGPVEEPVGRRRKAVGAGGKHWTRDFLHITTHTKSTNRAHKSRSQQKALGGTYTESYRKLYTRIFI